MTELLRSKTRAMGIALVFALYLAGPPTAVDATPLTTQLQPYQTGWMSTGALSRVPVYAPSPALPPAPTLAGMVSTTNYRGDPVAVPAWGAAPAGVSYTLSRSLDGENWSVVAAGETAATGGVQVPRVQDALTQHLALYRLSESAGGVEGMPGPPLLAERGSLVAAQRVAGVLGTSSVSLAAPCALFLEFSPAPGLAPGVYNLIQVGSAYSLLNLQVSPDGTYSIYCIASIGGAYRSIGESRHHTGRTAYLVVLDGPRSHIVADGVDDPQSHGDMTGFAENGPITVSSCADIGLFRALGYVPTRQEQGVLFAYAGSLTGAAYIAQQYAPVAPHVIVASLRPDPDHPIDFGPVRAEVHVTADGSPAGDGTLAHPLDLATALTRPVAPGTTVWLHGGWYRTPIRPSGEGGALGGGWDVTLAGAPGSYVQVRPWPGDTVVLDGPLNVQTPAAYLVLRDLYSTISEGRHPARDNAGTVGRPPWAGFELFGGSHVVLLHDVVAQCSQGIEDWVGNTDSLVYGCVLSDNGWDDPATGPRGHNVYVQNTVGTKRYARDISVRSYGLVFHGYGHGPISGLRADNCVFAGGSVLLGSQSGGDSGNAFSDNTLFAAPCQLGYQGTNTGLNDAGNLLTGPTATLDTSHYTSVTGTPTIDQQHSGDAVLLADAYDPDRWNLAVWGYGSEGTEEVTLDLSAVLRVGDRYELRQAGGYYEEPPVTGIYRGPVRVRIGGMFGAGGGAGEGQEPPSGHFDAFVLRRL